jgi:hypothetical protein
LLRANRQRLSNNDQFDYTEFDDRSRPTPRQLTRAEMAEVAAALVDVLELG